MADVARAGEAGGAVMTAGFSAGSLEDVAKGFDVFARQEREKSAETPSRGGAAILLARAQVWERAAEILRETTLTGAA